MSKYIIIIYLYTLEFRYFSFSGDPANVVGARVLRTSTLRLGGGGRCRATLCRWSGLRTMTDRNSRNSTAADNWATSVRGGSRQLKHKEPPKQQQQRQRQQKQRWRIGGPPCDGDAPRQPDHRRGDANRARGTAKQSVRVSACQTRRVRRPVPADEIHQTRNPHHVQGIQTSRFHLFRFSFFFFFEKRFRT